MGKDLPKVNFGDKYKFIPKEGPSPGTYDPSDSQVKPKKVYATIAPGEKDTGAFLNYF